MEQISIFECLNEPYKIDKPIRLIELFAGIGSQAKALKNIGANFEHYRVVEFDKYAIKSYNAIHGTNFETSDITQVTADDLAIVDTKHFTYLLTYSFPCQDLSLAGKGKGMEKGSGTRSGLLWEVERILNECKELPQVLLMENVPQVHGKKNMEHFNQWIEALEELGYSNYWQDLNAKNYGIPQNRNRTFMVSILGNYTYEFPEPFELKLRLKDMLEDEVDEKYFLSEKMINYCLGVNQKESKFPRKQRFLDNINRKDQDCAVCISTHAGSRPVDNFLKTKDGNLTEEYVDEKAIKEFLKVRNATKKGYLEAYEGDGIDISSRMHHHRGTVQRGGCADPRYSSNEGCSGKR